MTSIGEALRRERTRRGLDLKTVSNELKISLKFLEAIEAEAFDKLPGGMFTRSFVRQYSRYLGLDEDEMVAELEPALDMAPPSAAVPKAAGGIEVPRVEEWQVMNDRFSWSSLLPALARVVVVMLVCAAVYAWWQRPRPAAPAASAQVQPTPSESAPSQPAPAQPAQPEPQTAAAEPSPATQPATPPSQPPVQPPEAASAQHTATGSADRPLSDATQAAAAQANASVAPSVGPPPVGGPVRVELTALEPVWVLAQADGKYTFSGTLDANESRTVEANGKILLRLGNAGGVNIILNGKPIGSVGSKGQVKTIQLTSGGWTAAAPKPSLPVDDIL